jgi:(2Fe-2S) ferredoxin
MKTDDRFYDFHFFVCTNQKESGIDCASKGGGEVFAKLKEWSRGLTGGKRIRINKAGCLNRCAEGIACVAYPKGDWLTDVTPENIEEIKTFILTKVQELN